MPGAAPSVLPTFTGMAHEASRGVTHRVAPTYFCRATALTAEAPADVPVADAVTGTLGADGIPGAAAATTGWFGTGASRSATFTWQIYTVTHHDLDELCTSNGTR